MKGGSAASWMQVSPLSSVRKRQRRSGHRRAISSEVQRCMESLFHIFYRTMSNNVPCALPTEARRKAEARSRLLRKSRLTDSGHHHGGRSRAPLPKQSEGGWELVP